jgi:methylmalonyl-CoA/ethylmalonyl-CoA epimerase
MAMHHLSLPGIAGLHHVGYLTGEITVAAEHFAGAFGYQIESKIIDDPIQTARVQFLRQPGATSWLELISPLGPSSKLANALAKGITLHHLCYEVSGLDACCERLRERGFLMLGPPVPAVAFDGRRIVWFMDRMRFLFELVEEGAPPLSLLHLQSHERVDQK